MKNIFFVFVLAATIASCSQESGNKLLESKRKDLEKYKKELAEVNTKISALEKEIAAIEGTVSEFIIPVSVDTIQKGQYQSTVEFQAVAESDRNVVVSAENGGTIMQIHVAEGQQVSAGQILATLDGSIVSVQTEEIKNALELAKTVFEKQERLYKQGIGSEMQYLEAKNRYESLQKQLNSAQTRLSKFTLKAPFAGQVDAIFANLGAMVGPGTPVLRVVDSKNMKIVAQVPESYLNRFKKNDKIKLRIPALNLELEETIDAVSQVVNSDNRTFQLYIKPKSKQVELKPNVLAVVSAVEFNADSVIVIPTQIIKRTAKNETFVFVATEKNGSLVVEKRFIEISKYGVDRSIVESGLSVADIVLTKGYNSVDQGDKVKIVD